jgi:hypothetical protein
MLGARKVCLCMVRMAAPRKVELILHFQEGWLILSANCIH